MAVKYVDTEDVGALVEAGLTLFGENRAQQLEAKQAAHPDARWHFIGQLQSRKVRQIVPLVELIHSVASDSALRQLERHAPPDFEILVEVNVAREDGKAGIDPDELPGVPRARARPGQRADGDAAVRRGPGGRAARTSRRCASSPPRTTCRGCRWGRRRTTWSRSRRAPRSSGWDRYSWSSPAGGRESPAGSEIRTPMGFSDSWHRTMVYFGLAEDRDAYEEEQEEQPAAIRQPEAELEDRYRERPNVRRLSTRRRRDEIDDIFADDSPSERSTTVLRTVRGPNGRPESGEVRVHLVIPKSFNDAQDVADKFKDSIPVIINLQSSEGDLSKRLIDFASGLTYALDGGMQRIADKVFLLTPRNVELSSEERARLIEKGFFNQS